MEYSRRDFGRLALAALPAAGLLAKPTAVLAGPPARRPDSTWAGVTVGVIAPYAFQGTASTADEILAAMVTLGIGAVEVQNGPVEAFAGAPASGPRRRRGQKPTPEEEAARREAAAALKAWRLSVPMEKFHVLRQQYNDAGVDIYGFKLTLTADMSEEEHAYAFDVTKALGANQLTMELPDDSALTKRIGEVAARRQILVGYHAHTQATMTLWDEALAQSTYNAINLDIGHYVAGTSQSPIPLIRKHHDRIASLHLKDRKRGTNGGENVPWGQGDTPIAEVLQLMKAERYTFPATIELEYEVEGSNPMAELARCVAYCKEALGVS